MTWIEIGVQVVSFVSDVAQAASGVLVVFLYVKNKDRIDSVLKRYLRSKAFEDINRLVVSIQKGLEGHTIEVKKLQSDLAELHGRLRGNKDLGAAFEEVRQKIGNFVDEPKSISGPKVRAVVAELQEIVRTDESGLYDGNKAEGQNG